MYVCGITTLNFLTYKNTCILTFPFSRKYGVPMYSALSQRIQGLCSYHYSPYFSPALVSVVAKSREIMTSISGVPEAPEPCRRFIDLIRDLVPKLSRALIITLDEMRTVDLLPAILTLNRSPAISQIPISPGVRHPHQTIVEPLAMPLYVSTALAFAHRRAMTFALNSQAENSIAFRCCELDSAGANSNSDLEKLRVENEPGFLRMPLADELRGMSSCLVSLTSSLFLITPADGRMSHRRDAHGGLSPSLYVKLHVAPGYGGPRYYYSSGHASASPLRVGTVGCEDY
ncbi:uncharacterized protein MYCFIDRAFT_169475 [Pseudocercospora fijiensis CIRAD86]|uniref:Uncharacterized protein n=1 Tax=Pseudocercospora fijiensis (strain CIRAD86) TaxID=383855 RepID=N1Q675_PSEFD|nr:uncharacterized protein MYCFIDRAFT_169475 [Pseudocercospora fijiensis CIRAD86]EME87704.1 hypothetical protein MYCFIDRAFT_169475 [Pseudocercospora fijiensis CIRAD86]